ncbi:MAG: hypothetical protein WEB63_00415 [Cucumibacter sp.]
MERFWMVAIGGLVPALAFGVGAIFQKGAALQGMQVGTYILFAGAVTLVGGLIMRFAFGETGWTLGAVPMAIGGGLGMAIGTGAFTFALVRLGAPVSLIAPITVVSTLVTVFLSFLIFKEHEGVVALRLVAGALLVVAGAALVATS